MIQKIKVIAYEVKIHWPSCKATIGYFWRNIVGSCFVEINVLLKRCWWSEHLLNLIIPWFNYESRCESWKACSPTCSIKLLLWVPICLKMII